VSALDEADRTPVSALDETQTGHLKHSNRTFEALKPDTSVLQTTSELPQEPLQIPLASQAGADAPLCVTEQETTEMMEAIRNAYNQFASTWGGAAGWPKEENREAFEIFVRLVKSRKGMAQEIVDKAHGLKAPLPRPAAFLREIEHPRLKLTPINGAATKFDDGPMRMGGFRCKDRPTIN
jgi:hypothetical protein